MGAAAYARVVVRGRDARLVKEDFGHLVVVVLAGIALERFERRHRHPGAFGGKVAGM